MNEDYSDHYPQECPECGSERTYWIDIFNGFYKCEECSLIVDDDYWKTEPELSKGPNYPDED